MGRRGAGGSGRSSRCRPTRTRRRSPPSRRSSRASRPSSFAGEARKLKGALAKVAAGEAFLLQGGDCAESFAEHSADNIRDFFRVFLQMAAVLTFAGSCPVVKVGRIAGPVSPSPARPRPRPSRASRCRATGATSSNDNAFTLEARTPDPRRQIEAYRQSAATLNLLRAFATGGYANLENAHRWTLGFVKDLAPLPRATRDLAERMTVTLDFMRAIGIDPERHPEVRTTDFYTSHEALLLGFEEAMTRVDSTTGEPLRDVWAHGLDRRSHPPTRRRPR